MKLDTKPREGSAQALHGRWIEQYRRATGGDAPAGALDDARMPVRVGLIAVALFFGLFLLWAAFAPISGAAVAPGVITVAGNRQVVQSLNGGLVDSVLVSEGQAVRSGQILVRLNGVQAGSVATQAQNQVDALRALEARLIAERDAAPAPVFPRELEARRGEAVVDQALESQAALFAQRKRVFDAERGISTAKLDQVQAQEGGSVRQLALIREELDGMRKLYARGFAPKSRVLALERAAVELETAVAAGRAGMREAELVRLREDEQRRNQYLEELRQVQAQLAQVGPQLGAARYSAERNLIRAPVDGRVVGLAVFGPGEVLSPGRKVLDVLPTGRALTVQARVKPADIDDVRVGAEAHVRLTTVNPRGKSSFRGEVTNLSADRLQDASTGEPYYLAYISMDGAELARAGVRLQAGLPATVNITTHRRTFLDYLWSPLGDAISGSMRQE